MEKKLRIKQIIVIIIGIIIGTVPVLLLNIYSPDVKEAYKHEITQEDYDILKEYAIEATRDYSKTFEEKEIEVSRELKDNVLEVEVSSLSCKVIAKFPISDIAVNTEDGKLQYSAVIDYDHVQYSQEKLIFSKYVYLALDIAFICITTFTTWAILFVLPMKWKEIKKNEEHKKKFESIIGESIDI